MIADGCLAAASRSLWRQAIICLMALFLAFAYGIIAVEADSAAAHTLSLIFASITLEAMPFMLFGALCGGLIESFVSRERMTALLPKRGWLTVCLAACLGIIFPVCECAVIPVVRRLSRKGLPAAAVIAYLLGGPIVNPIVAASTMLAYTFDWTVAAMRVGLGFAIAVAVAFGMERLFKGKAILCGEADNHGCNRKEPTQPEAASSQHDDSGTSAGACGCARERGMAHEHAPHFLLAKFLAAFRHAADDFFAIGHFLVIGAFIAALAQTHIDRRVFVEFSEYPVLPSLLMMALAILLNLCSEADAFIAASFRGLMPYQTQIAFMLIGPMLDLKLLLMYPAIFQKRAIIALPLLVFSVVLAVALALEILSKV